MIKEVLDVMREMATAGMTMIVVTHEMGFAREVADWMMMFHEGVIVKKVLPPRYSKPQPAIVPSYSCPKYCETKELV